MKRILFILFLPLLFSSADVSACGNEYYRSEIPLSRKKLNIRYLLNWEGNISPYWQNGFGNEGPEGLWDIRSKLETAGVSFENNYMLPWSKLEKALASRVDFKLLSDYAWYEVRVGDREKAVKLLEALYKEHPGEYNILANLGTAYEVVGKPEKALEFLQKAVAVNPASHFGSEWIHINILKQKVAAEPDYRLILDLHPGEKYGKTIPADSLMVQLAYQLHERISFIAPPDPIVGQLVRDFADLTAMQYSPKKAQEFYAFAARYDSAILRTKPVAAAVAKETVTSDKKSNYGKYNTTWLLVIIVVVIAGVVAYTILKQRRPAVNNDQGD